jgi:hypothetical protein
MSLSAIWDRFWWSMILTILVGLLWLKFLEPVVPCVSVGLVVAVLIGVTYFAVGIRAMARQRKREMEIERQALEELMREMESEAVR